MWKAPRFFKTGMMAAATITLFGTLLAACGGSPSNEGASPAGSNNSSTAETGTAALPPVTLTWYFVGPWPQPDQDVVFAEVNKILKEKINATVDFKPISFGDYDQKMQVVIASGEPYDIAFTSNWINNYAQNVARGAFLPLDDLLAKYAPQTFASVPKTFWDAARVNGKIYGVIDQQISARSPHLGVSKKLADDIHFDINQFSGKVNPDTLNQLEPYLQAAVKINPRRTAFYGPISGLSGDFFNLETIVGIQVPGAVDYSDQSLKVVNQFETPQFKKYAALMRDWNAKGYLNAKELITKQDLGKTSEADSGFSIGGTFKPGGDVQDSVGAGYTSLEIPTVQPHLTTGGIISTMQAISRTSKNPERAMMLLELMNTDKDLYNLINFGIKGKHYNLDADGFKVPGDAAQGYNPNVPWMFATNYLAYVDKGMPKTVWEDTKKFNAAAIPSNLIGFSFDPEPVKAEIGKTSAVYDEYSRAIELGVADEAKYNEFLDKMKAAGSDKIINEMQKQIDAWKASKK